MHGVISAAANFAVPGGSGQDSVGFTLWDSPWWSTSSAREEFRRVLVEALNTAACSGIARFCMTVDTPVDLTGHAKSEALDETTTFEVELVALRGRDGSTLKYCFACRQRPQQSGQDIGSLTEEVSLRRKQIESILSLAGALTGAVSIDEVVDAITHQSGAVVGAAFSNLALLDSQTGDLELRHGPGLDSDIGERWPRIPFDDNTPLGRCIRLGIPIMLSNYEQVAASFPAGADDAAKAGFAALAAIPIKGGKAALGYAWTSDVEFDSERRQFLRVTADLIGDALERARFFEHEHMVADLLQQTMLPDRLPNVTGALVDARYSPGTAGLHVGGDWYDVVDLGDCRSMFAVGDVVGHGIEAAAAMGKLRSAFAALAPYGDLESVMRRLDTFAYTVDGARMSSVVIAQFDSSDGSVSVVSAGHLPPLIRSPNGLVEQLPDPGPPLGIDPSAVRAVHRTVLAPGATLVMYTDGLVEDRHTSIDDAIDRLKQLVSTVDMNRKGTAHVLYNEMGRPQNDDVAILTVHRQAV